MKKVFKIVGIVAIVVVVLVCLFCGVLFFGEKLEQQKLDNNRINNSKTLSQYIEYHGIGYSTDELDFYAEDIKCDLLKDRNVLHFNDNFMGDILILDDYTIYETAFKSDKVYSNGQQYKQRELDIKVKRLQIQGDALYLITEDNKYYQFSYGEIKEVNQWGNERTYFFLKNESIKKIRQIYKDNNTGTNIQTYIVLKDDGQIYEQEYGTKNNRITDIILKNEKVLFSNEDYGHITDFFYFYSGEGNKDNKITRIVSDKGLFYLKQTNNQQYIDTEPVFEMVSSDIYNKYKADIKYIDTNFVFTTDNNIIKTDMLCRDIDKDVLSDSEIAELNSNKKTESSSTDNSNSQTNENTTNIKNNSNSNNNKTNNKTENKENTTNTNPNVENKENTTNTNPNVENNNKQETETEEKKEEFITIKKIWMENDGGQFSIGDKVVIHAIVDSKYELKSIAMAVISDVNSASKHADQVSVTQNNTEYHYTYHLEITDEFIPGLWRYQCSVFQDKYLTRGEDLNNKFKFSFTVI